MNNNDNKAIAAFNSNHDALQAEKILKQNDIRVRPIIKPRKISSSCALALEFDLENSQKVTEICISNKFLLAGIFQKRNEAWVEM
ncbi:MAG: DUF3343 domain-containing protein [Nitrospinota bacterium]|nr:DUF3343 domain-containing protein [Nitrospinota bacterium]|tara:strand:- start:330 stop:584 length:255 start_codon:yes stop_codon:yes gene_type:complete